MSKVRESSYKLIFLLLPRSLAFQARRILPRSLPWVGDGAVGHLGNNLRLDLNCQHVDALVAVSSVVTGAVVGSVSGVQHCLLDHGNLLDVLHEGVEGVPQELVTFLDDSACLLDKLLESLLCHWVTAEAAEKFRFSSDDSKVRLDHGSVPKQ